MKNRLIHLLRTNAQAPANIRVDTSGGKPQVLLKGVISADFGVGANDLREAFAVADGADLDLIINSPGGDAFEGREMQSVIAGYRGKVTAVVAGVAASAATIVSMAAAETHMVRGSRYMIHNGWTFAMGNRHDMAAVQALLTSFDAELAADYARYTGAEAQAMAALMDAETWFTADQALESKFVQALLDNSQAPHMTNLANVAQAWNLSAYTNAPAAEPPPAPDLQASVAALREHNERRLALLLNT